MSARRVRALGCVVALMTLTAITTAARAQDGRSDPAGESPAAAPLPAAAAQPEEAADSEPAEAASAAEPPAATPAAASEAEAAEPAAEQPAAEVADEGSQEKPPAEDPAKPRLDLNGGAYLWHYAPFVEAYDSNTELYAAWLVADAKFGDFGFHFEPRFRDSKLRPFYNSNFWVQEVYAYWKNPVGILKVGKLYSRFGLFWDASFYGNLAYFDGVKLDPDVGASFEGSRKLSPMVELGYAVQYFAIDGLTNGSLQDRDTVSIMGARQRNGVVARVGGTFRPAEPYSITVGASGQHFEADFPMGPPDDDNVFRFGGDVELARDTAKIYGEYFRQSGYSVVGYPVGMPSDSNAYWQVGAQYGWKMLAGRYNLSGVSYEDADVSEILHQPGVTITLHPQLALLGEYVYWRQNTPADGVTMDHSFNFIVYASF